MKGNHTIEVKEIEIGHLDFKYGHTRIQNLKSVLRISNSIERFGQITPVIVVPGDIPSYMARANSKHARVLAENLLKESISTRDFDTLFKHYKKSGKKEREEIVNRPHVFIKALKMKEQEKKAGILKEGPEGKWIKEIKVVGNILHRLEKEVPIVFYEKQSAFDRRLLLTAYEDTKEKYLSLNHQIRRFYGKDDIPRNKAGHSGIEIKGSENPENQPDTEDFKKHSSSGRAGQAQRCAGIDHQISGDHAHNQRTVSILQGECSSGA